LSTIDHDRAARDGFVLEAKAAMGDEAEFDF